MLILVYFKAAEETYCICFIHKWEKYFYTSLWWMNLFMVKNSQHVHLFKHFQTCTDISIWTQYTIIYTQFSQGHYVSSPHDCIINHSLHSICAWRNFNIEIKIKLFLFLSIIIKLCLKVFTTIFLALATTPVVFFFKTLIIFHLKRLSSNIWMKPQCYHVIQKCCTWNSSSADLHTKKWV